MRSKGWRGGESARLPSMMWSGFKSRRPRHMWVEFVVGSLPCSERFFSRYSGFPLSSKTSTSKFQFDQELGRRRTTLWMCYLQIIIYLFYSFKVNLLIDNLIKDFLCKLLHKKHPVFIPQLLEIVSPVGDLRCFPLAYRSVGSSTRTYKDCINRDRNSLLRARQWRTLA